MSTLHVLSPERATRLSSAFEACLEGVTHPWHVHPHSHITRAKARQMVIDGAWDALVLDGRFADLTRSGVKVQAASMQVAGGADLVFARKGITVAVNLFGAGAVAHLESLGYSFGGTHVAVCGTGPRALALVQALAAAGADRIVLVDETPRKSEEAMRLYLTRYKRLAHATVDFVPEEGAHRTFAQAYEQPTYQFGGYTTSTQAMADADYLFAVGEEPFFTSTGVPEHVFSNQIVVYHAGVAPAESTFCERARAAGCSVPDGRGALAWSIAQGSAVLSQLHYDYLDTTPGVAPDTDDALLVRPLVDMATDAAKILGATL